MEGFITYLVWYFQHLDTQLILVGNLAKICPLFTNSISMTSLPNLSMFEVLAHVRGSV